MNREKVSVDIHTIQRVHFIGIGGIGMSGLARYFLHERKEVSGSDGTPSPITEALARDGVTFFSSQTAENITDDIDLIVYTEAMSEDAKEMIAARALGVPMMNYFEALGLVANPYYLIAVTGTHGKTTTTAMAIDIFESAGLDPTAIVGSLRAKTKSNFRPGKSKYCIVEACEYRRDFLHLAPDVLVITNIEAEHLDYYRDLADIQDAFGELARKVPADGYIVCDPSDAHIAPVLKGVTATVIDYPKFFDPRMTLHVPGMHNLMNAAAALGVAKAMRIDEQAAKLALEDFAGTWRRSEYLGETDEGALVFDDYAHHPTEVRVTLSAFKEKYPQKRLIVAFQPHLHSRTKDLFEGFVETLSIADEVVLAPIHEARTEIDHSVSSEMLAEAIGDKARAVPSYADITKYLKGHTDSDDLIITMGAGAINKVAEALVSSATASDTDKVSST